MRARGYKPFGTNLEQDALLDQIIAEAKPGTVGVFDLDGCLFDTRIRLVTIFHEFASVKGAAGRYFAFAERSDFTDWDLKKPLRKYGMPEEEIDAIFKEFIEFWRKRFSQMLMWLGMIRCREPPIWCRLATTRECTLSI